MRSGLAWRVRSFDVNAHGLVLERTDFPDPEPGTALARVRAAGAGLPDLLMARGEFPGFDQPGFIPGEEVVGEVVAVADGSKYAIGDRVMGITAFARGLGGYAEYAYVIEQSSTLAPVALSDAESAGFSIGFRTAWAALAQRSSVAAGESMLVLGAAGSTGSAAVQLGKAFGMRVIAAASSAERREFCLEAGADAAVDPRSGEFIDAVRGASDGGVDVVFDPVGGTTAATAMSALKRDGRILVVGLASGSTVPIDSLRLLLRNHTAIGVYAGGFSREADDDAWSSLQALAAARRITPQVRTVWQFDEVPAMIRGQDSPPAGKSVVIVSS